jgi:hypothetical protein
MKYYFCDHCDTGSDETQVGNRRVCPFCNRSLKLTSTTIAAHSGRMRSRDGSKIGEFRVFGDALEFCKDTADEDGSIHIDHLMDFAHDQEKLDMIEFLMTVGQMTDYVFLED